jgi:hypothetical protein
VKRGFVLGVLSVIGLLALPATVAQAGGGGTPSAPTSFFVCKSISGDDAARSVDVDSSHWGFNPNNVRVGNATLACAFAKLFKAGSDHNNPDNVINPNPNGTFNELKCYAVSFPFQTSSPPRYTFEDGLLLGVDLGVDADVHGSSFQYICAPASFTQNQ